MDQIKQMCIGLAETRKAKASKMHRKSGHASSAVNNMPNASVPPMGKDVQNAGNGTILNRSANRNTETARQVPKRKSTRKITDTRT